MLDASPTLVPTRWRTPLLLVLFSAALVLALLDKYTQAARLIYLWCMVAACIAIDMPHRSTWRTPAFLSRLRITGLVFGLSLPLCEGLRLLVHRSVPAREAWDNFTYFEVPWLWLAIVWLFAPFLSSFLPKTRLTTPLRILLLFTFGCLAMCFASLKPNRSFLYFPREIGIFAPLFAAYIAASAQLPRFHTRYRTIALWLMLLATVASFVVGITYAAGGIHVRNWIEARDAAYSVPVRKEWVTAYEYVWRLQFPFGHHNRLGYFSMLAALTFFVVGLLRQRRMRWLWFGGAAMAGTNLLLSLNRGAILGLACGAYVFLILRWGRRALFLLLLLPVAYLMLPAMQQQRLHSLFREQTYEQTTSTVVMRFTHWHAAAIMIRQNPLVGIGYSWRHFEQYYRDNIHKQLTPAEDTDESVHAHNLWLQVAAEVGIPLALVFFVFNFLRWAWLATLWRRRAALPPHCITVLALWICLELMIQLFCLVNLPVRRSMGIFTWGLWVVMACDLLRLQRALPRTARPTGTTSRPSP